MLKHTNLVVRGIRVGLGEAKYNMLQHWLFRLGITFVVLALSSSAALANEDPALSSDAGTTLQQTSTSDVEIVGSGDVQLEVATSSSQSSEAEIAAAAGSNSTTPPSGTKAPELGSSDPVEQNHSEDTGQPSVNAEVASTPGSPSSTTAQPEAAVKVNIALVVATYLANAKQAVDQPVGALPQAATAVHSHNVPNTPPNPTGLLGDLRSLLTSSLIPAIKSLSNPLPIFASSITVISIQLALLVLLIVAASLLLINSYLALLRRSGYTDAARSDVGVASLFLPLHLKMGFICVPRTL